MACLAIKPLLADVTSDGIGGEHRFEGPFGEEQLQLYGLSADGTGQGCAEDRVCVKLFQRQWRGDRLTQKLSAKLR